MVRLALIAALAGAMLVAAPANAQLTFPQEDDNQLDGGPPPLQVPKTAKPTPPRVTAPADTSLKPDQLKAEQARLARQAETQKTEEARLARLSADLEAQKTRLDARATELAKEEDRLSRLRADLDLDRNRAPSTASAPSSSGWPDAPVRTRVTYEEARRACTRAGMSEAADNNFFSARYESAPRFFERDRELRGRMRMDDRGGHLSVDTVCQLDANGAVLRFDVLR